jgi:hypothetical protein
MLAIEDVRFETPKTLPDYPRQTVSDRGGIIRDLATDSPAFPTSQ